MQRETRRRGGREEVKAYHRAAEELHARLSSDLPVYEEIENLTVKARILWQR
jgi:hypothetical protein